MYTILHFRLFLKIFLVGAGIVTEYNDPYSLLTISNCIFFNNKADLATSIDACHLSGKMDVVSTVFLVNFGETASKILIGSGAAIQMSGTAATIVNSTKNFYFFNIMEYKGLEGFVYLGMINVFRSYYQLLWSIFGCWFIFYRQRNENDIIIFIILFFIQEILEHRMS